MRCRICGRKLTDDESIARGIGPECYKRVHGIKAKSSHKNTKADLFPGQIRIEDYLNAQEGDDEIGR